MPGREIQVTALWAVYITMPTHCLVHRVEGSGPGAQNPRRPWKLSGHGNPGVRRRPGKRMKVTRQGIQERDQSKTEAGLSTHKATAECSDLQVYCRVSDQTLGYWS